MSDPSRTLGVFALPETSPSDVTQLLQQWSEGDKEALERLMPLVYDELRTLASTHLRHERRDHTLQTSALVNEAYLRLVDLKQTTWKSRARFFGLASQIIRNILVDYARGQLTVKRGSGERPLSLDEALNVPTDQPAELVALDDALNRFAALYPQQAKIVELRYFAGLTHEETAQVLDVSVATVARGWRLARAWLYRSLTAGSPG